MAKAKKRRGGPPPPPVPRTKEQKASARGMISGYLSRPRGRRPKTDLAAEAFYVAAQPAQEWKEEDKILLHSMLRKRHADPI